MKLIERLVVINADGTAIDFLSGSSPREGATSVYGCTCEADGARGDTSGQFLGGAGPHEARKQKLEKQQVQRPRAAGYRSTE